MLAVSAACTNQAACEEGGLGLRRVHHAHSCAAQLRHMPRPPPLPPRPPPLSTPPSCCSRQQRTSCLPWASDGASQQIHGRGGGGGGRRTSRNRYTGGGGGGGGARARRTSSTVPGMGCSSGLASCTPCSATRHHRPISREAPALIACPSARALCAGTATTGRASRAI